MYITFSKNSPSMVVGVNVLVRIVRIFYAKWPLIYRLIMLSRCDCGLDLLLACARCTLMVYIAPILVFSIIILNLRVLSAFLTPNCVEQIYYFLSLSPYLITLSLSKVIFNIVNIYMHTYTIGRAPIFICAQLYANHQLCFYLGFLTLYKYANM